MVKELLHIKDETIRETLYNVSDPEIPVFVNYGYGHRKRGQC